MLATWAAGLEGGDTGAEGLKELLAALVVKQGLGLEQTMVFGGG